MVRHDPISIDQQKKRNSLSKLVDLQPRLPTTLIDFPNHKSMSNIHSAGK